MWEEITPKIAKFAERAMEDFKTESSASLTPTRVTNYHLVFAGYCAVLLDEMGDILKDEPLQKSQILAKSEAERDRLWKTTKDGQRYLYLKHKIDALMLLIGACKSQLRRFNNESFNSY